MKVIFLIALILLLIGFAYFLPSSNLEEDFRPRPDLPRAIFGDIVEYQGPIEPYDNLSHFRKTGETIRIDGE